MLNISHYLQGVLYTIQTDIQTVVGLGISEASQRVVSIDRLITNHHLTPVETNPPHQFQGWVDLINVMRLKGLALASLDRLDSHKKPLE